MPAIPHATNDNRTDRELWSASLAATPEPLVGNRHDHTRRAYGLPTPRGHLAKPTRWIEPSLCRDDALSEAQRIAAEDSPFRTGFAWEYLGRWYAADERPELDVGEVVTVEVRSVGAAE